MSHLNQNYPECFEISQVTCDVQEVSKLILERFGSEMSLKIALKFMLEKGRKSSWFTCISLYLWLIKWHLLVAFHHLLYTWKLKRPFRLVLKESKWTVVSILKCRASQVSLPISAELNYWEFIVIAWQRKQWVALVVVHFWAQVNVSV